MNIILKNNKSEVPYYNIPLKKETKAVIIDADSMVFMVSYPGKDEYGNVLPEYREADYALVEGKIRELYLSTLVSIEQRYNISDIYLCIKGTGNFRKILYPEYKSQRPDKPFIVDHIYDYMVSDMKAIRADGFEADDLVYTYSLAYNHDAIIVAIDKDLLQIPSVFYNFQKDEWFELTEEDAKFNLAIQVLIGDTSDNINFTPRFGIKKALNVIEKGMSDYQYTKAIYLVYRKIWGELAKEKLRLCYKLLKLHNINNG